MLKTTAILILLSCVDAAFLGGATYGLVAIAPASTGGMLAVMVLAPFALWLSVGVSYKATQLVTDCIARTEATIAAPSTKETAAAETSRSLEPHWRPTLA